MFTPKALNTSRSRTPGYTPIGPQRRSSAAFSQNRRTSFTPRNQTLNRSLQTSQLGDETAQHRLETFGGSLPVLVTEVLAYAEKNTVPSVHLDTDGWACLVVSRKLLVWKYKPTAFTKISQCAELSLPPTEQKHTASLVTLFPGHSDTSPSCVAVSPEGVVRYWGSVSQQGAYSEVVLETKNEACTRLIKVEAEDGSIQCIVATVNSALFLISPLPSQNQVKCRPFRTPQGMLSGISRRMSSFIFGSVTSQAIGAPLHGMVPGEIMEDDHSAFFLLSGPNLQKWSILGDNEKMLYQQNVERLLGDSISRTVWNQDATQLLNLKTWLMDIYSTGDAVIVLGAAVNPDVSDQLYFGLGTLHTEGGDPPQSFLSFAVPQFTTPYQDDTEPTKMRLLVPDPSSSTVYLYDNHSVTCTSITNSKESFDKVDFHTPGDKLLGAGYCDKSALFFSNIHGLVCIKDVARSTDVSMREQSMVSEPTIMDDEPSFAVPADKIEEMSMSEDKMQRLKAAFLHFYRGHLTEAQNILDDLFPADMPVRSYAPSELDRLVAALSQEMVDDIPVRDPRWAETTAKESTGSTTSLILMHQLDDKLKAHEYLIRFLKSVNLWDRLNIVQVRDMPLLTRLLLCEHAEKLVAAKAFREMHTQHPDIVDVAVKSVLQLRGQGVLPAGLTAHDVFYREVSKLEEVLEQLLEYELECLSGNKTSREIYYLISTVNNLIYNTLFEAYQYRITKSIIYQPSQPAAEPECVPWTSSLGPRGIREILTKQHSVTVTQGLNEAQDTTERGTLYQQVMEMADMVLDGFKTQLESIKQVDGETEHYMEVLKKYQSQRTALISPFMQRDQYERAASLAEKYCDFGILVRLCEQTENQERLQRYMNQFQSKGFSDFVFRWYVEEGKRGKLMGSSLASHPHLSHFLQAGDNKFMSWLHDINANDFYKAHSTLLELANEEEKFLAKKKTLLSLSKLAALATDDPPEDNIAAINVEQDLVLHQEQLPQEVIESLGMDAENMKVLSPKEIIELYVSDYNSAANEFDFKKALDLLQYLNKNDPNVEYDALVLHIWCKAVLRDNWLLLGTDDPLENCKNTVFFKTIEMLHADEDVKVKEFLPSADSLLGSNELGMLSHDRNFQYLIRAGFEQIHRILT